MDTPLSFRCRWVHGGTAGDPNFGGGPPRARRSCILEIQINIAHRRHLVPSGVSHGEPTTHFSLEQPTYRHDTVIAQYMRV